MIETRWVHANMAKGNILNATVTSQSNHGERGRFQGRCNAVIGIMIMAFCLNSKSLALCFLAFTLAGNNMQAAYFLDSSV